MHLVGEAETRATAYVLLRAERFVMLAHARRMWLVLFLLALVIQPAGVQARPSQPGAGAPAPGQSTRSSGPISPLGPDNRGTNASMRATIAAFGV